VEINDLSNWINFMIDFFYDYLFLFDDMETINCQVVVDLASSALGQCHWLLCHLLLTNEVVKVRYNDDLERKKKCEFYEAD
jgi:hypothetical protein